jgi:ABC-2 type transport system permease protein
MKVIDLALKDFLHSIHSLSGLAFMLLLPLGITGLFYFMFGNIAASGGFEISRIRVAVANQDLKAPHLDASSGKNSGGFSARTLSGLIVEVLESKDLEDLLQVSQVPDEAAARAAVDNRQAQVAIIIPAEFSRKFADPNQQAEIEFYQDPTLTIGPGVVRAIMNRFMDGIAAIKITIDVTVNKLELTDPNQIGRVISGYLDASPAQSKHLAEDMLTEKLPQKSNSQDKPNAMARLLGNIMGGMMVFYAFYTGTSSAQSILREEEDGTLQRLFTTPTPQAVILGGKFLSVFLTVLVQVLVLLTVSHYLFAIQWGNLTALGCEAVGIILSAASFGILVNSLMKDTKQSSGVFGGVLTITGMLGMVSIFAGNSPSAEKLANTAALLVPQGWAIRGLVLVLDGKPLPQVLLNTLVLLAWSAIFLAVGLSRFNKRYA